MIRILAGMALLGLAPLALAQGNSQALIAGSPATQTETWLQMQREGSSASKTPQTATPAERELALQRLLNAYQHPIPEFFDQDAGGEIDRN